MAYAVLAAPNLTPLRDQYFLEKLVNLGENDGVKINQIFTAIFNIMGGTCNDRTLRICAMNPTLYIFCLVEACMLRTTCAYFV